MKTNLGKNILHSIIILSFDDTTFDILHERLLSLMESERKVRHRVQVKSCEISGGEMVIARCCDHRCIVRA